MKSIKPAVRNHGRIVSFLFLSLLILTSWGVQTAHADGVAGKITNGQTITGTLTGLGSDTYTFKVPAGGGAFFVSVSAPVRPAFTTKPLCPVSPSRLPAALWRTYE